MHEIYYVGLDIHKKIIAYCVKRIDGSIISQGTVAAGRKALMRWLSELPGPWYGAMEATIFTGWVYDFLKPHAVELKVAHPAMLKAITAAKKKNDRSDAEKIADLLRVNLLPECHMMPEDLRELRRILRYRTMIVQSAECGEDEEQDVRTVDGGRGAIRQETAAWPEIFQDPP